MWFVFFLLLGMYLTELTTRQEDTATASGQAELAPRVVP